MSDDQTLTSHVIEQAFIAAFMNLYQQTPQVRHVGGQWYYVNGETVHRFALMEQTALLESMYNERQAQERSRKSIVHRLISRLRAI
jgi:hypothetical protein